MLTQNLMSILKALLKVKFFVQNTPKLQRLCVDYLMVSLEKMKITTLVYMYYKFGIFISQSHTIRLTN